MEWNTGTYKYEIPVKKLIELLSNKPFSEITFEDLEDYEKELLETRDGNLSLSSLNSIDFADSDEIIELLKGTSYELSDEDLVDPDFFISDKMHDFYSKGDIGDSEIRFYSLFELKFDHETFGTYFVNWHYHSHYYDNLKSAYDGNRYSEALEWGLKYLSIHFEDPISQYFDNLESIDKAAKDLGDILKFIAHSFEKEKKFTEAIEYYGYLLIVKPESDFAKAHLGICYSALEES